MSAMVCNHPRLSRGILYQCKLYEHVCQKCWCTSSITTYKARVPALSPTIYNHRIPDTALGRSGCTLFAPHSLTDHEAVRYLPAICFGGARNAIPILAPIPSFSLNSGTSTSTSTGKEKGVFGISSPSSSELDPSLLSVFAMNATMLCCGSCCSRGSTPSAGLG